MKIIEWLLRQREVNRVLYPALPDNPGYKIWKKDFKGASGLFGVVLKNTRKDLIYKMLDNLKLFNMGYSWGGYESLILPVNPEKIRDTYKSKYPNWQMDGNEISDDFESDVAIETAN